MLTEHTSIDVLVVNNATLEGIGPLTELPALPRQRDPSATPWTYKAQTVRAVAPHMVSRRW